MGNIEKTFFFLKKACFAHLVLLSRSRYGLGDSYDLKYPSKLIYVSIIRPFGETMSSYMCRRFLYFGLLRDAGGSLQ